MAEKKYIDFPAGTYDPNKIFLQADPVTGELEKVNLPAVGGAPFAAFILLPQSDGTADLYILHNDFGGSVVFSHEDIGSWALLPSPDWPCTYESMDFQWSVGYGAPLALENQDLDSYGWYFLTLDEIGGSPTDVDAAIYVRITSFA